MQDSSEQAAERADGGASGDDPMPDDGIRAKAAWAWRTNREPIATIRAVALGVAIAAVVAAILLGISGVWPPFTAVTSSSMDPHIQQGDLVLVSDTNRYAPSETVGDTGIVTREVARDSGYSQFNAPGDVIIYEHPTQGHAIIHRAEFHVEAGENWYNRAEPQYLGGAENCQQLTNCPAPHDGFITKGDNNHRYDQVGPRAISPPVKTDWVRAKALVAVPYLGYIRLLAGVVVIVGGVGAVLLAIRDMAKGR